MWLISARGGAVACAGAGRAELVELATDARRSFSLGAGAEQLADAALSPDGARLALMTAASKRLLVFETARPQAEPVALPLPRAASRVRFAPDSRRLLVADKTGDALLYDLAAPAAGGEKLCGHLSLLLDALLTPDGRYVVTCDRDEKIRVSHFPNTYNVKAYCLGHREFVKRIELLQSDSRYLLSASGDGTVKLWDFENGRLCHTIDTKTDIGDAMPLESFAEAMDREGVEVSALPIVHMSTSLFEFKSDLIALTIYMCNKIFIYHVTKKEQQFHHVLLCTIPFKQFPSSLEFCENKLFVCFGAEDCNLDVFEINRLAEHCTTPLFKSVIMFNGDKIGKETCHDSSIKVLYKRKFDNVQEYQERKRQRLEKNGDT